MKKITLLLFLITASFSFGQVVLDEDFDAALTIPAGWTNNAIIPGPNVWTFETGGFAPYIGDGNTAFYTNGEFSGNYPILNSDAYGGGPEETALESPVFSCAGLTSITLAFKHFFVSGYGGEAYVEVFNGTTWVQVDAYNEFNVTPDTFVAGPVSIDVSTELAGVTNAQVRFRWVGDYSYYWAFDEVSVFECTVAAPNAVASPTPSDTEIDVAINTNANSDLVIPFSWVESATGDAADSFSFSLGITTTGDDIGTIDGVASGTDIIFDWEYGTTYYWRVDAVNCAGTTNGTVYSFTTETCTDTAPTAVVTPTPADAAVDIPIIINADGSRSISPFSWMDGTGDPGASFNLNIGITATGDDLGVVTGATNGNGVNYTWEYDTTYYWRVDAVNCGGTTNGTVWSFTTAAFSGDSCSDAIPVALGDLGTGDTSLASDSGVAAGSCAANGATEDLWFSFVASATGSVEISSDADHVVIYSDCSGTEVTCYTDASSEVLSGLTSGMTYYARVYNNGTAKVAGPVAILITESTLSTEGFETEELFTHFPNPVNNVLNLKAKQNITNVTVYNIIGQEVLQVKPDSFSSEINLSNMKSGAYFVKVTAGEQTETVRILKK